MFLPFSANWDLTESAIGMFCWFSWPNAIPGGPAHRELSLGKYLIRAPLGPEGLEA